MSPMGLFGRKHGEEADPHLQRMSAPPLLDPDRVDRWVWNAYSWIGMLLGGVTALVTFIAVYIAAVGSVGWVIGIALGWIPAGLAAAIAGTLVRWLWPLLALSVYWLLK